MHNFRRFVETSTMAPIDFLKTTPMQTVRDLKNIILVFLAGLFFNCGNYHKKHIVHKYIRLKIFYEGTF